MMDYWIMTAGTPPRFPRCAQPKPSPSTWEAGRAPGEQGFEEPGQLGKSLRDRPRILLSPSVLAALSPACRGESVRWDTQPRSCHDATPKRTPRGILSLTTREDRSRHLSAIFPFNLHLPQDLKEAARVGWWAYASHSTPRAHIKTPFALPLVTRARESVERAGQGAFRASADWCYTNHVAPSPFP